MTETLPPITDAEPEPDEPPRRRRALVWLGVGGAVAVAAGIGAWLWVTNTSTEPAPAGAGPVATAEVTRATLTATETWDGTLGRGSPFTIAAQGTGSSSASESSSSSPTVTRLPDQGTTVERGDELYRVNERPVIVLYGAIPMYRDLAPGDSGRDVRQLETNLGKLGYEGFTADDEYTFSSAEAVRAWQEDIGTEPTGVVARGDVVFVPEGGQVDTLHVNVGDTLSPGAPVLDITGTEHVVSLEVDVDDRDRFEVGIEATVVLPGGDEVAGTVSATAVVEVRSEGPDGDTDTESILQAEVTLNEKAPEEFIGAPVDVIVGVADRTDVLTVPVNALLALAEGGFGLEVVGDDGSTEIVAVETGLFAEGRVEVSGADIAEGTVVGVAGR